MELHQLYIYGIGMLNQVILIYGACIRPGPGCAGPFYMRLSTTHSSRNCSLEHSSNMTECLLACHQQQCCSAFGLDTAGVCKTSNVSTEALDFVIESEWFNSTEWLDMCEVVHSEATPSPPPPLQTCGKTVGTLGETGFTLESAYLDHGPHIYKILVYTDGGNGIIGIGITYRYQEDPQLVHYTPVSMEPLTPAGSCVFFDDDEVVTSIKTFTNKRVDIILGITIKTTHQVCGPFGATPQDSFTTDGQKLLYIKGTLFGSQNMFGSITYVFNEC